MTHLPAEAYVTVVDALSVLEYACCDWSGWLIESAPPASAHLRHAAAHLAAAAVALNSAVVVAGVTIEPPQEEAGECP